MGLPLGASHFNLFFSKKVFYSDRAWKDVARKNLQMFPFCVCGGCVCVCFFFCFPLSLLFYLSKQTLGAVENGSVL